jgi:hypothetical protein
MKAEENWTPSANGAFISFETTPPGSSTASRTERMRISGAGNVGIGTSNPLSLLHVLGASPVRILGDLITLSGSESVDFMARNSPFNSDIGGMRIQRQAATGDIDTFFLAGASGHPADEKMRIRGNGNVGIGTNAPQARLDVRGDVKLGSSGQFFATGGEENLKIIRGAVDEAGNIDAGSGFTVSDPNLGLYVITFATPFSGIPSVTGAGVDVDGTAFYVQIFNVSSSAVSLALVHDPNAFGDVNGPFHFIAIGPR